MKRLSFVLAALLITGVAFADKKCCKKGAEGKACCKKEANSASATTGNQATTVLTGTAATPTKACCKKGTEGKACCKKETATTAAPANAK